MAQKLGKIKRKKTGKGKNKEKAIKTVKNWQKWNYVEKLARKMPKNGVETAKSWQKKNNWKNWGENCDKLSRKYWTKTGWEMKQLRKKTKKVKTHKKMAKNVQENGEKSTKMARNLQ